MDGNIPRRTLVHSPVYDEQKLLHETLIEEIEDVVCELEDAIAVNPEVFDVVDGEIRIARTKQVQRIGSFVIPIIRIFFTIQDDGKVLLHDLHFERVQTDF